jgi:uncharacterized membrane protein
MAPSACSTSAAVETVRRICFDRDMEPTLAGAAAPSDSRSGQLTLLAGLLLLAGTIVFLWQSSGAYEIYKTLHIAFAVVWVGGGVALTIIGVVAERAGDPRELATIVKYAEKLGQRVFTPSSVVVLAFGIAMIEKGGLGWDSFWIDFALVLWAVSAAVGAGYLGPTAGKLHRAYEASGGEPTPEITALQQRILRVIRFDAAMLLLIVVDMAAKPSF